MFMSVSNVFAQKPQSIDQGLFIRTMAPASTETAFPTDAGFFRVNTTMLSSASRFSPEITRINNFPLGGKLVNLNVSQFDALTRDANISVMTAKGNIPFKLPEYALFRGEVEGLTGSHVYIAVFPDHALGYVEVPTDNGVSTRYLIQPVTINSEVVSTMIVYKQDAVDRGNDQAWKWNCGSEELPKNFKAIDRVSKELAIESQSMPQTPEASPRTVKLLKIDLDCDHDFYLDFKSDTTKGLTYALATLGAVSDVYLRDLNAGVVAQYLHIWAIDDPFPGTTNNEFLPEFEAYGGSSLPDDNRSSAILLSGVNGIGGLAYVEVICPGSGGGSAYASCGTDNVYTYPKDGFIWDVDVVAHEFGHNVGSLHTHNCSWAPAIDSCVAAEGSCYSTPVPTRGTIMSYCHLTPKGVDLKFHVRNIPKMKGWIQAAKCAPTVQLPIAIAGYDQYVCNTDSATFTGDGQYGQTPYSYSWRLLTSPIVLSTNLVFKVKPPTSTSYVMTLTDANNLRTYDTVHVTIDKPKANGGGNITVCGVGNISLNGSSSTGIAPIKYQWTEKQSGAVIGSTAIVNIPLTTTKVYSLKITDSAGCQSTDDIVVTVSTKPQAQISPLGPITMCPGDTVVLDGGAGFGQYIWSNGRTTQKINVMIAGNYSVIVSNTGGGCSDTSKTVSVSLNTAPAKPTITIIGDTLLATPGALSYKWYRNNILIPGASSEKFTPSSGGTFTVVVSNATGCTTRSSQLAFTPTGAGVTSTELSSAVTIFPNPANEVINIGWKGITASHLNVSITDLLGKTVYRSTMIDANAISNMTIDVKTFQAGTYWVHYSLDGIEAVKKFIKQ